MSTQAVAVIRSLLSELGINAVNVRSGPGTNHAILFKAAVDSPELAILDVQPDNRQIGFQGKVYQWFQVRFPDNQMGWLRDDLINIRGDLTNFGYPNAASFLYAVMLERDTSKIPEPAPTPDPASQPRPTPAPTPNPTRPIGASPSPGTPISPPIDPSPPEPIPDPTPPKPLEPATLLIIAQGGANGRSGPSTQHGVVTRVGFMERYPIQAIRPDDTGDVYQWMNFTASGRNLWVREDLLSYDGDSDRFGLPSDLYPSPMTRRWWVRGFRTREHQNHNGWDLGGAVGEPIMCGPSGAQVAAVLDCQRCTPARPNTPTLNDPSVFSDAGWGFGFGIAVILRYLHEQLPESTRAHLARSGRPNQHLYVIYAHLSERMVAPGQMLEAGQHIGNCGNTGNSSGPHLHLEMKASPNPMITRWGSVGTDSLEPGWLFRR